MSFDGISPWTRLSLCRQTLPESLVVVNPVRSKRYPRFNVTNKLQRAPETSFIRIVLKDHSQDICDHSKTRQSKLRVFSNTLEILLRHLTSMSHGFRRLTKALKNIMDINGTIPNEQTFQSSYQVVECGWW